ncbi:MAG: TraR/DksA C4-type zinc finger protein [Candidatus Pacebacteria bacterium]|nr:TraR/DksA C4-type zinc finger protein [Candidatus Paceibacterota bacterium]
MFDKEFLEKQKERLKKEKEDVTKLLSNFAERDKEDAQNWETKYPDMNHSDIDPEDQVDEVEEFVDLLPAEYALEVRLKNVNEALKKIEEGVYGVCENCNRPITVERLEANPSAKKCLDCLEM